VAVGREEAVVALDAYLTGHPVAEVAAPPDGVGPRAASGRAPGGWALYEALVADLPGGPVVGRYLVGQGWTVVDSGRGMGLAMTFPRPPGTGQELRASLAGRSLREVAQGLRSWDLSVAAIGMAAVNAHYNRPDRLEELLGRGLGGPMCEPVFVTMADEVAGRKVAVVGHFPGLEPLAARCEVTVLEREPQPGDLPDPAAEFLLPEQDYVFITGTTLINKTLPRLLQLCAGARVVLVGPSVPFTTDLFDRGVDVLAGSVVVDPQACWTAACEGGGHEIWISSAVRLQVRADDF
jgi:hypothetical protein